MTSDRRRFPRIREVVDVKYRVSGHITPHIPAGPLLGLLGLVCVLPPGNVLALFGEAGAGKSALALTAFERPHVTTSEMGPSLVIAYARRNHAEILECVPFRLNDDNSIDLRVMVGPGGIWPDVVLDSGSGTGDAMAAMKAAKRYAETRNARVIVIMHVRKDGRMRGSAVLEHEPDVLVELTGKRLEVKKSRHGQAMTLQVRRHAESGVHKVRPMSGYFSIEGDDGDAPRLVPVPGRGSKRAGVFKKKAGLKLPPPPFAASALKSHLYESGWVEPDDQAERVAYAHAHGIPYFSPVDGLQEPT